MASYYRQDEYLDPSDTKPCSVCKVYSHDMCFTRYYITGLSGMVCSLECVRQYTGGDATRLVPDSKKNISIVHEHYYLDPSDVRGCRGCRLYIPSMLNERYSVRESKYQWCNKMCIQKSIDDGDL